MAQRRLIRGVLTADDTVGEDPFIWDEVLIWRQPEVSWPRGGAIANRDAGVCFDP